MKVKVGTLGEMQTEFTPQSVTRQGDYLVASLKASGPVEWYIQVALNYRDVLGIARMILKPVVCRFLLFGFKTYKNPKPPESF